jgi:hypothetical protein
MKNLKLYFVLACTIFMYGCFDDDLVENFIDGGNKAVLFSQEEKTQLVPIDDLATITYMLPIELIGTDGNALGSDTVVNFSVDNAQSTAVEGTNYTFDNGLSATIPAGSTFGFINVNIDSSTLDVCTPLTLVLTLESTDSGVAIAATNGQLEYSIKATSISSLAGSYRVLDSSYFRIGVESTPWTGDVRTIELLDCATNAYLKDYTGPFSNGQTMADGIYFTVDETGGTIDVLDTYDSVDLSVFDGVYDIATCTNSYAGGFVNQDCSAPSSNTVVFDNVEGKHVITMIYGYYGATGANEGQREFFEVLEKIVD